MTVRTIAVLAGLLFSLTGCLSASEKPLAPAASSTIEASLSPLKPGEAKGSMTGRGIGINVELKYAYARKIQAMGGQAYSLVLTDIPYSEDILKKGDDLSDAVRLKNKLHFIITTGGKIATMSLFMKSANDSFSSSKAYASSNRKSVNIGVDSIEGEISEEDSDGWSYKVIFKS